MTSMLESVLELFKRNNKSVDQDFRTNLMNLNLLLLFLIHVFEKDKFLQTTNSEENIYFFIHFYSDLTEITGI